MISRATKSMAADPSDEVLWAAARDGSEIAFEQFFTRHRPLALRIAATICGGQAEDAVQAAFFSAWRSRKTYNSAKGGPRAWLMAVVRNRAIDDVRMIARRHEKSETDSLVHIEDPVRTEDVAIERDTARRLREAIAELPSRQRQVLELGYFAELTQSEIAGRLGLPLGTVKGRSRLALKKMSAAAV
ncbi:sigma-70 family RNA polymerase sigma factor [soil metagenome]